MQDYLEELLEMSLLLSPAEYDYSESEEGDIASEIDDCAGL